MNDLVKDSLAGGITAAASLSGNQIITIATAIGAPAISSVAVDFASRALSKLQSSRLVEGIQIIAEKIGLNIQSGKSFRSDNEMSLINGEEAQQVLEGILQNISDEYEKKKIKAHASLFTNMCFDERIVFEQAICISKIVKEISYRQLCIIAYSFDQTNLKTSGWQARFKDFPILASYGDFYCELFHLEQRGILQQDCPGQAIGGVPLKISELGKIIYNELSLEELPLKDISLIGSIIDNINKVISGKS